MPFRPHDAFCLLAAAPLCMQRLTGGAPPASFSPDCVANALQGDLPRTAPPVHCHRVQLRSIEEHTLHKHTNAELNRVETPFFPYLASTSSKRGEIQRCPAHNFPQAILKVPNAQLLARSAPLVLNEFLQDREMGLRGLPENLRYAGIQV